VMWLRFILQKWCLWMRRESTRLFSARELYYISRTLEVTNTWTHSINTGIIWDIILRNVLFWQWNWSGLYLDFRVCQEIVQAIEALEDSTHIGRNRMSTIILPYRMLKNCSCII
jgi:hypothetical protein